MALLVDARWESAAREKVAAADASGGCSINGSGSPAGGRTVSPRGVAPRAGASYHAANEGPGERDPLVGGGGSGAGKEDGGGRGAVHGVDHLEEGYGAKSLHANPLFRRSNRAEDCNGAPASAVPESGPEAAEPEPDDDGHDPNEVMLA